MAEAYRVGIELHTEGLGEFKKVEQAATSTGKAFDKLAQSERQAAEAGKAMGSSNSDMARNLAALAGIGLSAYGLKVLAIDIAKGTYALGQLGAQAITVRDSFVYMTQSVGMNAGMLKQLQAAAGGTINSMKLMELSNMALVGLGPQVGNALASQEARLIEISRAALKANPAIGSVEFAYNSLVLGVKRLEKRLVDNIGLQVKVNDANEKYAASIGKTVDQLSAEDKQMAMLNAILEGGGRLIQQVGGDVNTMNDSFLRATVSAQEFKIALGEALAPSMSAAAEGISKALDNMTAVLSNDEIQKKAQELKNLQETQAALQQQEADGGPIAWWIKFSHALELGEEEIARVTAELEKLKAESEAGNMTTQELEARGLARGMKEVEAATNAYSEALDELRTKDDIAQNVAEFAFALEQLNSTRPTAPDLGDNALFVNTDEVFEYISAMEKLGVITAEQTQEQKKAATTIATTQSTMANAAIYSDNLASSMGALAQELFGTEASALDLMDRFDELPPVIQSIIGPVMDLEFAIAALRGQMSRPLTLNAKVQGLESVYKDIERASLKLVGIGVAPEKIRAQADAAKKEAEQMWRGIGETDAYGLMLTEEIVTSGFDDQVDAQVDSYNDSLKASDKYWSDMQRDAEQAIEKLKGLIEQKLEPSFSVDDLAPDLVVREDAVDEHYRRLAAIALRGQEEIDKHNVDWADTISQIPAEVRAKGIEAMQAWAKDKVIAYGKGLDNSLVNRERIKALVMEQLQANKMRDELINEIFNEMGGTVSLKDVQAAAGDVTGTGSAIGQAISTGVKDSIDVEGMLKITASQITAASKTYSQQLKTSGGSVGGIILDGITTAVTDGAPDIVKKLAESLAPSVAKILENNARRSGQ